MVSLLRKLLPDQDDRLAFAGMVVVAANAGGVWTPIGDVTTTMLWIGGQITSVATIKSLFLPSVACLVIPMAASAYMLRGRKLEAADAESPVQQGVTRPQDRKLMFFLGLSVLIGVPVFKTITHLPPFMGILLGLGLLWVVGDLLHRDKPEEDKRRLTLVHALSQIDLPSVMFFVGILLCVATLEHAGLLATLASDLDAAIGRQDLIVLIIGAASAIVDNVPLVAACMGMYPLSAHPADSFLWQFLAYCTGTGGSILLIGSAAGVAAMGMEGIRFGWYMKRVSALAVLGYLSGAAVFMLQHSLSQ
jgi:Na+/H+ antiporter NhaD/arsenite permease-like protein